MVEEKQDNSSDQTVAIVGGGLAGIAAAVLCRQAGCPVTLLESRQRLGGRATSYVDAQTGETIDNCQHVSMGCCTQLRHLCESLGIRDAFETVDKLYFVAPDGRITPFSALPLPAPLHLSGAFARLPYITWNEKRHFASAVKQMARTERKSLRGVNLLTWLKEHHQTENLIHNVWEVVLISALSESIDRIDAAYAQKVFTDGFLAHRDGWKVEIPTIDLDELYSERTLHALEEMAIQVRLNAAVEHLQQTSGHKIELRLRDGEAITASNVVCAVPHHRIPRLVGQLPEFQGLLQQVQQIESAPITSVHFWFDRPIMDLPHAVLIGRLGHWVFNRGERSLNGQTACLYQVVMSASRNLEGQGSESVIAQVANELRQIWPATKSATLVHSRMVTERRAVFSATPGIDQWRPPQQTAIPSLQIAGDWTQTGWPATMEGAVRSGYLAAMNILRRHNLPVPDLPGELPVSRSARWLLRIPKQGSGS
ncbi:MAG: hydroxysqualene dehydroxylase HpnE [Planctomycetaceae bacterium]|nr:hydroxysqualene dehydroxylase HpnE [Planctomycetaceae bacterium]